MLQTPLFPIWEPWLYSDSEHLNVYLFFPSNSLRIYYQEHVGLLVHKVYLCVAQGFITVCSVICPNFQFS